MYFFATGRITRPDKIEPHMDEEGRVLDGLRSDGTVLAAFRFTKRHGVIGVFEGPSLDDVRAQIDRLPFVALGLMTFEYEEVAEL